MFRNALFVFIFFFISLHAPSKIDLSLGLVNGKTGEHLYTYDTEERVSYLRWQIKNIPIVIVNFSHSFENLEFSLGGKRNIGSKKSGRMRDYDWYTSAEDGVDAKYYGNLSNFSDNYNKIDKLLSIDANAKYWFRHSENFKSAPIIGFKYDEFKFHGYGGIQYNYNPDGTLHSSFSTGDSSGGVEYTQKFKTPYVGYEIS